MKEIKAIYKKDLERIKSEHKEMKEALKDIIDRYPLSPWIINRLKELLKQIES